MIGGFQDATKIPELRRRALFTLLMLVVYRIGVFVPTPGIDAERLVNLFEQSSKTLFGIVNMFSGGALENFSIFALGIGPYITMSIIIQLMATVNKRLGELQKEGEQGRRVITRYTRVGTVFLALFQGTVISYGLASQGVVVRSDVLFHIETAVTLAAGTAFMMWLGEQITERGIGNGISLIIMAGIVARMPATILQTFELVDVAGAGGITPASMLVLFAFGIATVAFIVFVEKAQRRIPVQYPKRAMGRRMTQSVTQYFPLKINMAGVLPPIFASVLISFPLMLAPFVARFFGLTGLEESVRDFSQSGYVHNIVFIVLVIFFCFFYTSLVFEPDKVADNLKKNGGFIPTIRPGVDTANYFDKVVTRLTFWGAIYIACICVLPQIFYSYMGASGFSYFFGGTAVLIVVGVTLDTLSQIESHVVARNYEGFMSKGPGKMRGGLGRLQQGRGRLIQR